MRLFESRAASRVPMISWGTWVPRSRRCSRRSQCRGLASQRLGEPEEETAPRTELRCPHAHAGAVANFIDPVERVDHVEPRGQCARLGEVEHVVYAEIDLRV